MKKILCALSVSLFASASPAQEDAGLSWPKGEWQRHTIDDSSQGADGTRFADINGDGLFDITTPWEQGGEIRVYLHPGDRGLRERIDENGD